MPFVLDSSVALSWILPDENDDNSDTAARTVAKQGAIVPPLWWWEVQSALLMAERRKRIVDTDVDLALRRLAAIRLRTAALLPIGLETRIARQLHLSVYDASYVALALEHGALLMTRDEKLAAAAQSRNILWQPT